MIFLAQSDTTVGFLSKDDKAINRIKKRPLHQKVLKTITHLSHIPRVPRAFRHTVRLANKATFVLASGQAFRRVLSNNLHYRFLNQAGAMYSSSANQTGKSFDMKYALMYADVVIVDRRGLYESTSSTLYKLKHNKKRRLR